MTERVRWKVSAAWLSKPLDCTYEGITKRCGGCCHPSYSWSPTPADPCPELGPNGCNFTDERDRPARCLLYPLRRNKRDTLILTFRAKINKCAPNFGKGPPVIVAMEGSLVGMFGREQYERAKADVLAGRDSYFEPSDDLLLAFELEQQRVDAKALPMNRRELVRRFREDGVPGVAPGEENMNAPAKHRLNVVVE